MKFSTTTAALLFALQLSTPAFSQAITAKWIGPGSCGSWTLGLQVGKSDQIIPNGPDFNNALLLNWMLGFTSGFKEDILRDIDVPSVASWLENYCRTNPLAKIPEAAFALRADVLNRRKPPSH